MEGFFVLDDDVAPVADHTALIHDVLLQSLLHVLHLTLCDHGLVIEQILKRFVPFSQHIGHAVDEATAKAGDARKHRWFLSEIDPDDFERFVSLRVEHVHNTVDTRLVRLRARIHIPRIVSGEGRNAGEARGCLQKQEGDMRIPFLRTCSESCPFSESSFDSARRQCETVPTSLYTRPSCYTVLEQECKRGTLRRTAIILH